jgi:hypothetical protein
MPTSKLTRRSVEAFEPALDRQIFLWDTEIRGFGVRALPSGLKTFIIQYRNASGAKHRINLGRYGLMTVEQARDLARIKLGAVAAGDDPAEALHRDRNGMTVGQVCDWYLEEAEAERLLGRRHKPIAKSTLALDRSRIEQHVRPLLGNRSIQKLTIADLERFQADVKEGKTSKDRKGRGGVATGGAGVAGRTIGMLHTIFEQAARWRIIEGNPARGVRKISVDVKRDRRLSVDELKRFTTALEEHKATSPVAVAAINLILLSGFRRMEALGLKWDWVDREEAAFVSPIPRQDRRSGRLVLRRLPSSRHSPRGKDAHTFFQATSRMAILSACPVSSSASASQPVSKVSHLIPCVIPLRAWPVSLVFLS